MLFASCGGRENNSGDLSKGKDSINPGNSKIPSSPKSLPDDYLGLYEGSQEPYDFKNEYGEDLILAGNKIPISASEHRVVFKENNKVSVDQINKRNKGHYIFQGTYSILSESPQAYKMKCDFTYGKSSKLIYLMTLDKSSLEIDCEIQDSPGFKLSKSVEGDAKILEVYFEGILGSEWMHSGEWSIEIQMQKGLLKGQTVTIYMSTSGLGVEDQNQIEVKGNVGLDGSDFYNGRSVKGVLVSSTGEFVDLSGRNANSKAVVWRLKELNFN